MRTPMRARHAQVGEPSDVQVTWHDGHSIQHKGMHGPLQASVAHGTIAMRSCEIVPGQLLQRLSNMLWICVHLCAHTVFKACKIAGVHAGTDGHGALLVSQLPHK